MSIEQDFLSVDDVDAFAWDCDSTTHQVVDANLLFIGVADNDTLMPSGYRGRGGLLDRLNAMRVTVALKIGRIYDIFGHLDGTVGIGVSITPAGEMIAMLGSGTECGKVVFAGGVLTNGNSALTFVDAFNH